MSSVDEHVCPKGLGDEGLFFVDVLTAECAQCGEFFDE